MKMRYLFPSKYKKIGWVVLLLGLCIQIGMGVFEVDAPAWLDVKVYPIAGFENVSFSGEISQSAHVDNILDEIISVFIIVGCILVAFSKTKEEDEYISKIRIESLIWATYVNYGILILAFIFVYNGAFLTVMIYNLFTILIFFVLRFHFMLYKSKKQLRYEE